MPVFTGKSINMSVQEALEDAIRQAVLHKAEDEHALVTEVNVTRIFAIRTDKTAFHTIHVEIEAK